MDIPNEAPRIEKADLWKETFNEKGESSIRYHTPKVVWVGCKAEEHDYRLINPRLAQCKNCGNERTIIIGLHTVENGKIIEHGRYT